MNKRRKNRDQKNYLFDEVLLAQIKAEKIHTN